MKRIVTIAVFVFLFQELVFAGPSWYARMENDRLFIGNSLVERVFEWNGGNLMTVSLTDKAAGVVHNSVVLRPDAVFTETSAKGEDGTFEVEVVEEDSVRPAFLRARVCCRIGSLEVRREFRIYDDAPVLCSDIWLRGRLGAARSNAEKNHADRKNIEAAEDMDTGASTSLLDQLHFAGSHWHVKAVEFTDITDWNNNLVTERDVITYRKNRYRGNIAFVRDGISGNGYFFLKESPCSDVQLAYPGADFIAEFGHVMVTGTGLSHSDVNPREWTKAYSCVTGVYGPGELAALTALRKYQKNIRRHVPERDEMVMMNTWGDRSQDSKVNEKFCLEELEKAAALGISHFQIDDGWQSGKSPNSALAKGSFRNIWDNPLYWTPDAAKYPEGLAPVVERGKELGINIGLWYNPSVQNDFADWEKDAEAITGLYRKYGIRVFKIDGLAVPTKKAETNLRRLFDKVGQETGNAVIFNLDVTAGRRAGYHAFNEYGNIFLENRYTDWGNYYPYWTLRNLWMLSRYVPAEKIQVEFLNKWRNASKYGSDPFAPSQYSFEYLFAIAMAGQPLAWMEASNLPEEAFGIGEVVKKYRQLSGTFHDGIILPIGDEPSGCSWTGFQSICGDDTGFVLVLREASDDVSAYVKTWLPEESAVKFVPLLGNGKAFRTKTGKGGSVRFSLPSANDYVLYRYYIKK